MKPNTINFCVLIFMFSLKLCYSRSPFPSIPKFDALFVFGDSTVETGSNNYLHSTLKANYYPYGINFTSNNANDPKLSVGNGRFSDGKAIPDMIASFLGIKELVPPFLDPKLSNQDLLSGVNFASSGSGFDDLTTVYSNSAPISEQLFFFRNYLKRINRIVGESAAKKLLGNSLVVVSAGSYDWILNFYNPPRIRRMKYDFNGYSDFLIEKTQQAVQELYDHGFRTIIVTGLPPIGCLPIQLYVYPPYNNSCVLNQIMDPLAYNTKLSLMLHKMQFKLGVRGIIYADIYTPMMDMVIHPLRYGIRETKIGCCNQEGVYKASYMCYPTKPCQNPSQFLFWDNIHTTEAVNKKLTQILEVTLFPFIL